LHDVMATFADMTGQTLAADQAHDSISFLQALTGTQEVGVPVRDHLIIQGSTKNAYAMTGSSDLVNRAFYQQDVSGDRWKLIVLSDSEDHQLDVQAYALFNLSIDPGEATDRFADPTAQVQLTGMLVDYLELISQSRTAD
jgi:hypothetical protein